MRDVSDAGRPLPQRGRPTSRAAWPKPSAARARSPPPGPPTGRSGGCSNRSPELGSGTAWELAVAGPHDRAGAGAPPAVELVVLAVAGLAAAARPALTPGELLAAVQYAGLAPAWAGRRGRRAGRLAQGARGRPARLAEVLDAGAARPTGDRRPAAAGWPARAARGHGARLGTTGRARQPRPDCARGRPPSPWSAGRDRASRWSPPSSPGSLDPDEGEVLLDGVALPRLTRPELRRAIGHAAAGPVLIGDTVADAIALGAPGSTAEQVTAAARAARADGFVRRLPQGYETPLTDAPMSGGEAQRVGIARAFAQAGRVLVLDDVASSLDTVTEHHIGEVLGTALADRTRLVVAHRTSTAARTDLVVWLERGRVHRCGDPRGALGGSRVPGGVRRRARQRERGRAAMSAPPVRSALGAVLRRNRRSLTAFARWSLVEALPALASGQLVARAVDDGFLAGQAGVGFGWLALLAAAVLIGAVATRRRTCSSRRSWNRSATTCRSRRRRRGARLRAARRGAGQRRGGAAHPPGGDRPGGLRGSRHDGPGLRGRRGGCPRRPR